MKRAAVLTIVALAAFLAGALLPREILHPTTPPVHPCPAPAEAYVRIAAVRSDGPGVICGLTVTIMPGTGNIFTAVRPWISLDFQGSERIAVKVASKLTGVSLNENGGLVGADVIFAVLRPAEGSVTIQEADGPSVGAAMTVAMIAAIENKGVKENVIVTGTIREDGSIGPVGGIFEKAQAANDCGAELFLVPRGQSKVTMYKEIVRQEGSFRFVTYEPVIIDLNAYAEYAGWNLRIQEVSTIEEVLALMLEGGEAK
jgi:uncharacterized protein